MKFKGQKIDKELILDWYFSNKDQFWVKVGLHCFFWFLVLLFGWFIHFANFPNIGIAEWTYHFLTVTLNGIVFYLFKSLYKNSRWFLILFVAISLSPVYVLATKYFFVIADFLEPHSQYIAQWKLIFTGLNLKELFTRPESYLAAYFFNARILFLPFILKKAVSIIEKNEVNRRKLEDNIRLELSFLRSQVNPHFLFNSLNNIYGQTLENHKATNLIIALSNLLRYSLNQPETGLIRLQDEVKVIENYSYILDSFFEREGSIEIIGEPKGDIFIRSLDLLRPFDCLFDLYKFERKESQRIIEYNDSQIILTFDLWLNEKLEQDNLNRLLTNVQECLAKFSDLNKPSLRCEKVEDLFRLSYSTSIAFI